MSNKYPDEFYSVPTDKVITRLPPEPNMAGGLHLGHIKAAECDFGFAEDHGGQCIMRIDDTNPATEKQEYADSILENVSWLGYKPCKFTYTSDYFDVLYDYAITLIKQGDAYVCDLAGDEISSYRERREDSPYKTRTIDENLKLFQEMTDGKYEDHSKTLRMKGDITSNNPCMWDLIFYRINLDTPHYRTGSKWKIYPSYDYSHSIVDSIEGITHSFCTKEFQIRRETYFWVLDKLNLRKPLVYEFSRLNIKDGILSKRKILQFVSLGVVDGFDDPRLLTIEALRRKGYTPSSLRKFCNYKNIGITQNDSEIDIGNLENILREELDSTATRKFVVKEPLLIEIVNLDNSIECLLPEFPNKPKETAFRKMMLTKNVFIDSSNFREIDSKDYYGLAVGKIVRLKYSDFIKCISYEKNSNGKVVKLKVELVVPEKPKKIKGILNWVNENFLEIELREFNGMDKKIYKCLAEPNLNPLSLKEYDRFQFERYGYYCVDKDSTKTKTVFNQIVSLKSSF